MKLNPIISYLISLNFAVHSMSLSPQADNKCINKDFQNERLINAAINGETRLAKSLLKNNADININSMHGQTPLMLTVIYEKTDTMDMFLKKGAELDHADKLLKFTALIHAAKRERIQATRALLEKNLDINATDISGNTALMHAATNGNQEIARLLILNKADVNIVNLISETALSKALEYEHIKIIKMLLDAGASTEGQDFCGDTIMMSAASQGNSKVIKILIEKKADINTVDEMGETAIMKAASNGHTEAVYTLSRMGAKVNTANNYGYTALSYAIKHGHTETVRCLVRNGANINANHNTELICAVEHGNPEIIKFLIQEGANINSVGLPRLNQLLTSPINHQANMSKAILLLEAGIEIPQDLRCYTNEVQQLLKHTQKLRRKQNDRYKNFK